VNLGQQAGQCGEENRLVVTSFGPSERREKGRSGANVVELRQTEHRVALPTGGSQARGTADESHCRHRNNECSNKCCWAGKGRGEYVKGCDHA
jgi:hypothetical protein